MKKRIILFALLVSSLSIFAVGMPKNIGTMVVLPGGAYPAAGTLIAKGYMDDTPGDIITESSYGSFYNETHGMVGMNVGNFTEPWEENEDMVADFFYNGIYAGTMNVFIYGAGVPIYNTQQPFQLNTDSPRIYVDRYSYLYDFGQVETGSSSEVHTFSVAGFDLTEDNLVITAPAGFLLSDDNFASSSNVLNIAPASGTISERTIYVKFAPSAVGEVNDVITLSTSGASSRSVKVYGDGLQGANTSYIKGKVFLQGAYDSTQLMKLNLNSGGHLPLTSPYADASTVTAVPADVVDWISVELRAALDGATLMQKSMFLKQNGTIAAVDYAQDNTVDYMKFDGITPGQYYMVIRHRNHVDIISSSAVQFSGSPESAGIKDFTSSSEVYTSGPANLYEVETDVWAMFVGDVDDDGSVVVSDNTLWKSAFSSGVSDGYHDEDMNFDSSILSSDNSLWKSLFASGVPDTHVPDNSTSIDASAAAPNFVSAKKGQQAAARKSAGTIKVRKIKSN